MPAPSQYPKISIVTPSFNQGRFLEETICSVLEQGYPNLEYMVIDGGSTDGSVEIIRRYADRLAYWVSEPDMGQYDAINKGMVRATGEIMAYLNSDDKYCPWTLGTVGWIFECLPAVQWLTSRTQIHWNEAGAIVDATAHPPFARSWFYRGQNLGNQRDFRYWIQQESTFWRRELWQGVGGRFDESLHYAGDFDLWARFWQTADLYSTNVPLGGWRRQSQQKTAQMDKYYGEAERVLARYRGETYHNRAVLWLLGQVLRWTGRGGQRFGSRAAVVKYGEKADTWRARFEYVI